MGSPCFELGRNEIMSNLKLRKNMEKVKIEIKNRWTGSILFEYEKEDNTINDTVMEAVKNDADLRGADLRGADLRCAYLGGAYLGGADLGGAELGGADLGGAYLRGAKNISFIPFACPSDGSFVGWKKISDYSENYSGKYLVKLRIPDDARRCSANTTKCRCDKAEVLEITNIETNEKVDVITNTNEVRCVYKVGEMVYPDSFDEDRWNECSHGIHFFINKQEAIDY